MIVKMKVYLDFICLFCFLVKGLLDEVVKEKDVEIEWMLFELCLSLYLKIDLWNELEKLGLWDVFIFLIVKKLGIDMCLLCVLLYLYIYLVFEGC